ncbi:protein sorting system archaetidylserine decarboxylase [Halorhabdus salina]|uniref:protein sorting system archaetidylserine decarboxylase n=1 Tax=Halorhabdus salina TaxID=2750670 RepID=UPI0015EECDA4|nr:protein sorting system archaetidylserine decarboxylase [Halorhabdus salina]
MRVPFVPESWKYVIIPLIVGGFAWIITPFATVFGFIFSTSVLAFYRDPDRQISPTGVASPADGTVSVVREDGDQLRVGIYMSVTDVHVNHAPIAGRVTDITHQSGAYKPAFSKESENNEQLHIDFEDYRVILIAGWFARRIHPYIEQGDSVSRGDRIGYISFGSRADVVLPPRFTEEDLAVEVGDTVSANHTTIAVDPREKQS